MVAKDISTSIWQKIPFHDVDAGDIVWHGHYLKYFELARCELLEKIDYSYQDMADSGYFWPVVNLEIKYQRAALFNQMIEVVAVLEEWEYRIRIKYEIRSEQGEILTTGYTDQVPIDAKSKELHLGTPPRPLARIEQAIAKL